MKKIIVSFALFICSASAFAVDNSGYVLEPLSGNRLYAEPCSQSPRAPAPASNHCVDGRACPVGYEPVGKYCWDRGFHPCGITCRIDGTLIGG